MKKIITVLFVLAAFVINAIAQKKISSTVAENSNFKLQYTQWTDYSSAAGYYVAITNYTNETITIDIELTAFGIVEMFTLEPNGYNVFQVGYPGPFSPQLPYINDMRIKATIVSPFHSTLQVRTAYQ